MKRELTIIILIITMFPVNYIFSQADTVKLDGVKVIIPSKEKKKKSSYFIISGGYQLPAWYRVPMIPEYPQNMIIDGNMDVKVPGKFAGIGIMKKSKSRFEFGILANYYETSIPIAMAGQRSTSDWVYEQSGSYTTDFYTLDIDRISEVFSIRATVRYKIPAGKLQFWGGVSPGTYSSKIEFTDENTIEVFRVFRETSLGVNLETGMDFLVKNKKGKEILMFTLFSDISGPRIEENMNNLFKTTWKFENTDGNNVVNPIRLGFAIGIL